jgi:hypothetical protein
VDTAQALFWGGFVGAWVASGLPDRIGLPAMVVFPTQLPAEDQAYIAQSYDAAARENKALRDNLEHLNKEIIRLAEERDAEIREITTQHEEELKRLTKELDEEAVQAHRAGGGERGARAAGCSRADRHSDRSPF